MKPTASSPAVPAWSAPLAVTDVPDVGRHLDLEADEAARRAIADTAGLVDLPRLEASFDVTRRGTDGLHVVGRVAATVVQSCVVTLEPVENQIEEAVDLTFLPDNGLAAPADGLQSLEVGEPPEVLRDGSVDLGAIATEFLLLGIDPYPRKPGAVFDAPAREDPSSHPFAALAALKKPGKPD
jgi:uncharacterized metal-binding protein YceD (DUF177 family)